MNIPSVILRYTYDGCPWPGLHVNARSSTGKHPWKDGESYVERSAERDRPWASLVKHLQHRWRLILCVPYLSNSSGMPEMHSLVKIFTSAIAAREAGLLAFVKGLQEAHNVPRWYVVDPDGQLVYGVRMLDLSRIENWLRASRSNKLPTTLNAPELLAWMREQQLILD